MVTGLEAPLCAAAAADDEDDEDDDWPMLRGGATPMRAPLAPMTSERARGTLPSLSRQKEYMRRQRTSEIIKKPNTGTSARRDGA